MGVRVTSSKMKCFYFTGGSFLAPRGRGLLGPCPDAWGTKVLELLALVSWAPRSLDHKYTSTGRVFTETLGPLPTLNAHPLLRHRGSETCPSPLPHACQG